MEAPRGSEKKFATDQDVIAKFRKLAGTRMAAPEVDRVVDLIMNAERLASAKDIATALGTKTARKGIGPCVSVALERIGSASF